MESPRGCEAQIIVEAQPEKVDGEVTALFTNCEEGPVDGETVPINEILFINESVDAVPGLRQEEERAHFGKCAYSRRSNHDSYESWLRYIKYLKFNTFEIVRL